MSDFSHLGGVLVSAFLARALANLRRLGRSKARIEGFDPVFYRRYYPDLHQLTSDDALARHFQRHGCVEARFPNADALIAALEQRHGALPDDFVPLQYRSNHADLAEFSLPWQLKAHYLRFGRAEGRTYRSLDLAPYERAFERLRAAETDGFGSWAGISAGDTFAELLSVAGVLPGAWLKCFVLHEFAILNASWLPRHPVSRIDGLCLFLQQGVERLAPIALSRRFDPDFYRAQVNADPGELDADLYRRWLGTGIAEGLPGSEGEALLALLREDRFPDCFDETAYRARLPRTVRKPGHGRFAALAQFVTETFQLPALESVRRQCSARLLEQIGEHHILRGDNVVAHDALNRAIAAKPGVGRLHHRRGDALRALGREREATADYLVAAEAPDAIVWSHIHAAEGLAAAPDVPEAVFDRLLRSAPRWCSSPHWRDAAHRVIERVFEAASARAHTLYAAHRRTEADAVLTSCLDRIVALLPVVDPLPAPLPPASSARIVLVANRDLSQCDHYRVIQKVEQLERLGWHVEVFRQAEAGGCRPAIDAASAVIFYRVAALPNVVHAILYARALGVPTLYEIDDLLFDPAVYPDPFDSFEGQITPAEYAGLQYGVPLFRYAMRLCETGLASTPALADAMRPLVRSGICHVLRNGLDSRNEPFIARGPMPAESDTITLFYGSGTKAHNRDFNELVAPALIEIFEKHAAVRLVVAGYLGLDERFRAHAHRIRQLGFDPEVGAYWEVLSSVDINIAVLAVNPMTDAKSEIKWLEAAMCGLPSVVTPTRTYREVLVDGEDVLFAATPAEWATALKRLISDSSLRRRIGLGAHAKARTAYTLDVAGAVLARALPPLPPEVPVRQVDSVQVPRTRKAGRARLLFVHVYFPPQTIGGATRVLRDNVDHLIAVAADRFEIAIAASDLDAEPAYRTRIDNYRGLPVYRIAVPAKMHMDWRPFDPEMEEPFAALVDRLEPDLVHFHCVQRLTGSVVEVVQARGVPYFITLHDAWWISDFQFLTDADGILQVPCDDVLTDATDRKLSPISSIARRRRLGRLLDGATALLAVSDAFAEVYRRAGYPQTIAVPNGVSSFTPRPRIPGRDGCVRLGHVGGRTAHKGASLLEVALREGAFENLDLTLVDHSYPTDYTSAEVWGATPIRIVGRLPQDRIAELYAELDVLLAPSIWPESFGLVTREARAAGLWVVASDRGAIGQDIRQGVDGFRIDVGSLQDLRGVLARLNAEPDRFSRSPPETRSMRTESEQGDDLIALYTDSIARRAG